MKRKFGLHFCVAILVTALGCDFSQPAPGGSTSSSPSKKTENQDDEVVLFCGLDEGIVRPLVDLFERRTGIRVNVKFGESLDLAKQLAKQEKDTQLADVFWSADPGALQSLLEVDGKNRLAKLTREIATRVPSNVRAGDLRWVGVSARVFVPVQNSERQEPLPVSFNALLSADPALKIGVQDDATLPALLGWLSVRDQKATAKWLMDSGSPILFSSDLRLIGAVAVDQIDVAIVPLDALLKRLDLKSSSPVKVLPKLNSPGFVALSCAGVLDGAEHANGAKRLIEFLVSDVSQQYLASTAMYSPVVDKVISPEGVLSAKVIDKIAKAQASSWASLKRQEELTAAVKRE